MNRGGSGHCMNKYDVYKWSDMDIEMDRTKKGKDLSIYFWNIYASCTLTTEKYVYESSYPWVYVRPYITGLGLSKVNASIYDLENYRYHGLM